MFNITVTDEILEYARDQVARYNFGQRSHSNGSTAEQLTGIVGQALVQELLGYARPDGANGSDDGYDFDHAGLLVDVKTMGRTTDMRPDYVHNFMACQLEHRAQAFVFCSYNIKKAYVTVCGCCDKALIRQISKPIPAGSQRNRTDGSSFDAKADMYEIRQEDLIKTPTLGVLRLKLNSLTKTNI